MLKWEHVNIKYYMDIIDLLSLQPKNIKMEHQNLWSYQEKPSPESKQHQQIQTETTAATSWKNLTKVIKSSLHHICGVVLKKRKPYMGMTGIIWYIGNNKIIPKKA